MTLQYRHPQGYLNKLFDSLQAFSCFRAPTSHPHRYTTMQWQRRPAGVCLDYGQPGRPSSLREEGIAALMLACPGAYRLALNFLLILSLFLSLCCLWQNLPRGWALLTLLGWEGHPQWIFNLPIQRCHGSKNLDSEDKESRVWSHDSDYNSESFPLKVLKIH